MNNYYECARCDYKTNKKSSMITHINKKKICNKKIESFKYSDQELYNLSFQMKYNKENILENKCDYCNKTYVTKHTLNRHIEKYCKKEKKINEKIEQKSVNIENNTNNIVNNIDNSVDNTVNNIYIINNINMPITFDKDWNTEHMDIFLKQLLLLAENKYTDLLKKLLENKKNLNVILDKKTNIGYVYNGDNEYKDVEKDKIVSMSMEKLYNQLNKMKDEVLSNEGIINIKNMGQESKKIEDKYNDFINNKNTQKKVGECISDIFDTQKDEAIKFFENNQDNQDNDKIDGY